MSVKFSCGSRCLAKSRGEVKNAIVISVSLSLLIPLVSISQMMSPEIRRIAFEDGSGSVDMNVADLRPLSILSLNQPCPSSMGTYEVPGKILLFRYFISSCSCSSSYSSHSSSFCPSPSYDQSSHASSSLHCSTIPNESVSFSVLQFHIEVFVFGMNWVADQSSTSTCLHLL